MQPCLYLLLTSRGQRRKYDKNHHCALGFEVMHSSFCYQSLVISRPFHAIVFAIFPDFSTGLFLRCAACDTAFWNSQYEGKWRPSNTAFIPEGNIEFMLGRVKDFFEENFSLAEIYSFIVLEFSSIMHTSFANANWVNQNEGGGKDFLSIWIDKLMITNFAKRIEQWIFFSEEGEISV